MTIKNRVSVLSIGLVACLVMSACEITDPLEDVELIVDVSDATVDLGNTGIEVGVQDGQTTAAIEFINNNLDVDEVELSEVKLKPAFFTFSKAGKGASLQDTGTLLVLISIGLPSGDLHPLPLITVTISDNVVTDVQPGSVSFAGSTYDIAAIEELLESLPDEQKPDITELGGLTIEQTMSVVEEALMNATGYVFSIIVHSDGVSGDLTLREISIDARIRQGAN